MKLRKRGDGGGGAVSRPETLGLSPVDTGATLPSLQLNIYINLPF